MSVSNLIQISLKKIDYNNQNLLNKILEWRNDETTRYYSNNTNMITNNMFNIILEKYKESNIDPLIIYNNNNEEIGIITFVKNNTENKIYIGINISPKYRDKKIGSLALNELVINKKIYVPIKKIYASVKKENIKSIKLFEKYFIFDKETELFKEYFLDI